ncbi:hypothetical protein DsansV1_C27g0202911 [Dioscorea sansibarensis]
METHSGKLPSHAAIIHSQSRRIREEDLRIGEATGEVLSSRDRDRIALLHLTTHIDAFLSSRPIHPSSPLGHRTAAIDPPVQ